MTPFDVAAVRKNRKIPKLRQRERLKAPVTLAAWHLHKEAGLPFHEELFERVGRKFGIGRSVASDIFYAADNPWRALVEAWLKNPKFKLLDPDCRED